MTNFPNWQLHRGFWRQGVRENTMEAFRQAKENRCQMIELDVQCSREGVLHVIHDPSLKRFFHIDQKVAKTSSEDLSGLGIPTLREVLDSSEVPDYLNIEVKSTAYWPRRVVNSLVRELEAAKLDKKVLVSSFNPMVLFCLRKRHADLPRALIVGDEATLTGRFFERWVRLSGPHFINCHFALIDDEHSREHLLFYEKPLMVWTVNDHAKAQQYLTRGAISIISDLPPR